ncbi:MAG: PG0870-related protein [Bacteroidia bacterium]
MSEHPYILQKYKGRSTRYECPECHKHNEFSRYMDTETGEYLAPHAGKCNRIVDCGYHYTPKQFFEANKQFTLILLIIN